VLYDANGWCSGALVTENFVVSGANRLQHLPIATVLLGISDIDYVEDAIAVDAIILHEDFDPITLQNDIALLHLARPAFLSGKLICYFQFALLNSFIYAETIQPIALPAQRHIIQDFVGELGRVSGWGGETDSMEGVPV
jgi:secreted trypsin-like serine protease